MFFPRVFSVLFLNTDRISCVHKHIELVELIAMPVE